jgi:hypothetical protein
MYIILNASNYVSLKKVLSIARAYELIPEAISVYHNSLPPNPQIVRIRIKVFICIPSSNIRDIMRLARFYG